MDTTTLTKNPVEIAARADLIYVNDDIPGFTRRKHGQIWRFYNLEGELIKDTPTLQRIRQLGIPPAYIDIWICPIQNGHLQATGRDAKGRKQYRYHPRWREFRSQINHGRMIKFGEALPRIRRQVDHDLNLSELSKDKVLATIVKLMDLTTIRVGNDEYAKENHSYGLTTLREKHVDINHGQIRFEFKGKSHQKHVIEVKNRKLAQIVQRCMDVPGYDLFQYYDARGQRHGVNSGEVNQYLHQISGQDFTAKDFRTWWGTVFAMIALQSYSTGTTKTETKRQVVQTVKEVSKRLGNTPAVCKKYYIYPGVIDSFLEGRFSELIQAIGSDSESKLSSGETRTLKFLERHLQA